MSDANLPGYRLNVGAALFNRDGRVLVGRRADRQPGAAASWQMPQGGIDAGEDPRTAVLRELEEEIGTARATILCEHPEWLTYDLPPDVALRAFGGRYRGQRQKWFALRFDGDQAEIALDRHVPAEFDAWRWVALGEVPALAVVFKRQIYETIAAAFSTYAVPA